MAGPTIAYLNGGGYPPFISPLGVSHFMTTAFELGQRFVRDIFSDAPIHSLDSGPSFVRPALEWYANSPIAERVARAAPAIGYFAGNPHIGWKILGGHKIAKALFGRGQQSRRYTTSGTGYQIPSPQKQKGFKGRKLYRKNAFQKKSWKTYWQKKRPTIRKKFPKGRRTKIWKRKTTWRKTA